MGMGIPWEWELKTKLGMEMGRNAKQPARNGNGPYCHGNKFPLADAALTLYSA